MTRQQLDYFNQSMELKLTENSTQLHSLMRQLPQFENNNNIGGKVLEKNGNQVLHLKVL